MSKWHYIREDEIKYERPNCRDGKYLVYNPDIFDKLRHDKDWIFNNDAFEEHEWIIDNIDKMLESCDGKEIFIPTIEVANKIDDYYMMRELESEELFESEMNW